MRLPWWLLSGTSVAGIALLVMFDLKKAPNIRSFPQFTAWHAYRRKTADHRYAYSRTDTRFPWILQQNPWVYSRSPGVSRHRKAVSCSYHSGTTSIFSRLLHRQRKVIAERLWVLACYSCSPPGRWLGLDYLTLPLLWDLVGLNCEGGLFASPPDLTLIRSLGSSQRFWSKVK